MGKDKSSVTTPIIPPTLEPLYGKSAQGLMGVQSGLPLTSFLGSYPAPTADLTPSERLATGAAAGGFQSNIPTALALQYLLQLPGLAGAGPTTGDGATPGVSLQDLLYATQSIPQAVAPTTSPTGSFGPGVNPPSNLPSGTGYRPRDEGNGGAGGGGGTGGGTPVAAAPGSAYTREQFNNLVNGSSDFSPYLRGMALTDPYAYVSKRLGGVPVTTTNWRTAATGSSGGQTAPSSSTPYYQRPQFSTSPTSPTTSSSRESINITPPPTTSTTGTRGGSTIIPVSGPVPVAGVGGTGTVPKVGGDGSGRGGGTPNSTLDMGGTYGTLSTPNGTNPLAGLLGGAANTGLQTSGATPFGQSPGILAASQRVGADAITGDPVVKAAMDNWRLNTLPELQNQMGLSGLGHGTALASATGKSSASLLAPLYQDAAAREQARLGQVYGATESELNRRTASSQAKAQAVQSMIPMLLGMGQQQSSRNSQTIQDLLQTGGTQRQAQQDKYSALYNDFLRRQAISEEGVLTPFGQLGSTGQQTNTSGGAFK